MNLDKLKRFGELQDEVMATTGGELPLVAFYDEHAGISVHNPFLDVTGRFIVDPIKEYGKEKLALLEAKISDIESDMGCPIEEIEAQDLHLYLGGKFYLGKEPGLEVFEKITFDDEPMFLKHDEESKVDDTLNFYIPLFKGFEKLIPEAALTYVCPVDSEVEVNLYLDYDIPTKEFSLYWTSKYGGSPSKEGVVKVPERATEGLLAKMDAYAKELGEESLEKMVDKAVNEDIWRALEEAVKKKWYAQPDENGNYSIEISADYRETNEGLLEDAYDNRDSVELKNSITDAIYDSYEASISDYEYELLDKAGFGTDSPYHDQAWEMMQEKISFSPDYDHFMKDDMRVNLLIATDKERNCEFTDIRDNLYRQSNSENLKEMQEDAKNYGWNIDKPDNGLMWLIEQQGYTLQDLRSTMDDYRKFIDEGYYPNGNERVESSLSYDEKMKLFRENHSKFLTSVCEELDNQSYSMGCLTILVNSSLEEYCDFFERDEETNNLVPKEIVLPKEIMLGIHNPWNGSGSCLGIDLEKDIKVPNNMIFDVEIEGVKRDHGWTVDEISGLVGSCWKESKGVQKVQKEIGKPSLDDMIHGTTRRNGKHGGKEVPRESNKEPQR